MLLSVCCAVAAGINAIRDDIVIIIIAIPIAIATTAVAHCDLLETIKKILQNINEINSYPTQIIRVFICLLTSKPNNSII